MKRLTHIAMAALLVSFSAAACNDDPLLDLDTVPPTADAGADQTVADTDNSGSELVQLDGSGSTAGSFPIVSYTWTEGGTELVGATVDGGRTVSVDLDVGVHNITLTVEDEAGRTDTDDVVVEVVGPSTENPTITITSPTEGAVFSPGDDIDFAGSGVDQNSNVLAGDQLVWSSDVDGELGTGAALTLNTLSTGPHVITLTGTDGDGFVGTATVNIAVSTAPTAEITAPADASEFFNTELITFTGTGTDVEDGALTGASLVWTSDVDGELGTGVELLDVDASTLTLGAHVITLTATDADGATGEASINITINEAISVVSFPLLIEDYFTTTGCTGCHGGATPAVGVSHDTWEGIVRGEAPDGDPLIVIGDAAAASAALLPRMALAHGGGPADAGIIESFETWINDGAPNNE